MLGNCQFFIYTINKPNICPITDIEHSVFINIVRYIIYIHIIHIYIHIYIWLNNIEVLCLHIFVFILLSCCIDFMVVGGLINFPQLIVSLVLSARSYDIISGLYIIKVMWPLLVYYYFVSVEHLLFILVCCIYTIKNVSQQNKHCNTAPNKQTFIKCTRT